LRAQREVRPSNALQIGSNLSVATNTRAIGTGGGPAKPPTAIRLDRWTVVVEYEDGPRLTVETDTQAAVDKAADEAGEAVSADYTKAITRR
jgi:hypothetical protein